MRMVGIALGLSLVFGLAGCNYALQGTIPGNEPTPMSAQSLPGQDFKVIRTVSAQDWDRIECLSSTLPNFPQENERPNGRQRDPDIIKAFGSDTPPACDVLLHYGKNWQTGTGTPVLLVHGAVTDANGSWIHPGGKPGLAPFLESQGLRVFAVTFAHSQGDNLLQAEQIAEAIERIKQVTGASKVDVVAHSKGTMAARALASNYHEPGFPAFRKDIHRLVLLAAPNLGLDYTFRHPLVNYGLYPEKDQPLFNAPMSWTKILYNGIWTDTTSQTMMPTAGNYFPGQSQLLYRWDKKYPLPENEPDWYTTYYGGQGFVSDSPGIDAAIAAGGYFIDNLRRHPVDPSVQLAVFGGDVADIPNILNEDSGPSDGIVFTDSAMYTDDMTKGGAKLIAKELLPMNHVDLIEKKAAWNKILGVLQQP